MPSSARTADAHNGRAPQVLVVPLEPHFVVAGGNGDLAEIADRADHATERAVVDIYAAGSGDQRLDRGGRPRAAQEHGRRAQAPASGPQLFDRGVDLLLIVRVAPIVILPGRPADGFGAGAIGPHRPHPVVVAGAPGCHDIGDDEKRWVDQGKDGDRKDGADPREPRGCFERRGHVVGHGRRLVHSPCDEALRALSRQAPGHEVVHNFR